MFDIAFIDDEPPYLDEEGWTGLGANIKLGDFSERFVAPIGLWQRVDYERQWIDGARRLIEGKRESAFVAEAGRLWWTAWRVGQQVLVQQRLLVDDSMARAWAADLQDLPYNLVGQRDTVSNDGEPLSEWKVTLPDLRAFVSRQPSPEAG